MGVPLPLQGSDIVDIGGSSGNLGLSSDDKAESSNGGPNSGRPRPKFAWSYIAVKHPKITTAVLLLIPIICASIIVGLRLFSLTPFELGNFYVTEDVRTKNFNSLKAALTDYPFDLSHTHGTPERSLKFRRNTLFLILRSTRPNSKKPAKPDKTTPTGNVLTPEGLEIMRKAEKVVLDLQDYPRYCHYDGSTDCNNRTRKCALPESLTRSPFAYGDWNYHTKQFCGFKPGGISPVSYANYTYFKASFFPKSFINDVGIISRDVIRLLRDKKLMALVRKMPKALGKDFSRTNPTSQVMRSVIPMGLPVKDLSTDQLMSKFGDWAMNKVVPEVSKLSTPKFHVQAAAVSLMRPLIMNAAKRAAMFAAGSVALVFFVVAIHTGSFFLALITMLQILLSFPITYVIYRYIFQIEHFGVLNVTTLFLLLGIGADDVFVFTDTWHQAGESFGPKDPLIDRMIYTYRRAVKAMTLTTFTTSIAFLTTMTSAIMPINTLGAWAGILVVVQYLLVITIYPCALMIHHQFAGRFKIQGKKKTDDGNDDEEKGKDVAIVAQPKSVTSMRPVASLRRIISGVDEHGYDYRPIEKFFNGRWTNLMQKLRFPLIIVALALLASSGYFAPQLQPPVEQEQILPESNPMYSAILLQQTDFPALDDGNGVMVHVMFGVNGSDRRGISRYNNTAQGKVILDNKFSLRTAEAQKRLLHACNFFENFGTADKKKRKSMNQCWVKDFAKWRARKNATQFVTYANELLLAEEVLAFGKFKDGHEQPYLKYLESGRIGMTRKHDRVVFTKLSFATDLVPFGPVSETENAYYKWEKALEDFNATTRVDALKHPFVSGGDAWAYMRTQETLKDSAVSGLGIMLGVACTTLTLSTGNIVVALLATFCLASVLSNILAVIQLIGWAYGIAESICIVIAVGFSFDYVAHLVVAYAESKHEDRVERTRDALTALGISVIAGATSTLLAGCMLLFASIVFLFKFGALIAITIAISVVWSLAFLPVILLTIGPQGSFGRVSQLFPGLQRRKRANSEQDHKV